MQGNPTKDQLAGLQTILNKKYAAFSAKLRADQRTMLESKKGAKLVPPLCQECQIVDCSCNKGAGMFGAGPQTRVAVLIFTIVRSFPT